MERPRIGVGVILLKEGKVLLGKRKSAHGEDDWCFPGGHLEHGESIEESGAREVLEETGIIVQNLRKGTFTNDIFPSGKHYVTLFLISDTFDGEAAVKEPEKCERWEWFNWHEMPEPLFLPIKHLLEQGYAPIKK
ncbi:MAG: NUDIX hydrolase [Nanoarchaeota archaeon]